MFILMILLIVALLLGVTAYYFFFFLRVLRELFPKKKEENKTNYYIISLILALIILRSCLNLFGGEIIIVIPFLIFSLLFDLLFFFLRKKKLGSPMVHRLYTLGIYPLIVLVLFVGYGYYNMTNIVKTTYDISTEKTLTKDYRIAFLSDLHFGTTMDEAKLERVVERIDQAQIDLFLLGGDIVDEHTTKKQMQNVFDILSKVTTKYGIYYVYGNHDQTRYFNNPNFTTEELQSAIEESGIEILRDTTKVIENELVLIGRDDFVFPLEKTRKTVEELLQDVDTNQFLLLIDHQPKDLKENAKLKIDLQLSGHTHAGQIFPTGILSEWVGINEMNYGYRKDQNYQIVVSSGIGGWDYPLRTGAHSEYVILDIHSKKA